MAEEGTKRRSEAEYRVLLSEHARSGQSLKEFAASRGLNLNTLYGWHRRLRGAKRTERAKQMVPVQVVEMKEECVARGGFDVTISGDRVVSVPSGFDADELRRLLAVLES